MRVNLDRLLLSLFACIVASPVGAGVTVSFIESDSFTDLAQYGREADFTLREIEMHLKHLGERYLPANKNLKIDVLDIDLAGRRPFPIHRDPGLRILEGKADRPSIKIHYVLESENRVLDDRHENVSDIGYPRRLTGKYPSQPFPHEKRMLDEWFAQRFAKGEPVRK